jgi:enoyl reductase
MGRVIVFNSYGGPDVLKIVERDERAPTAGQMLVRVEAAGVQPFDTMFRGGRVQQWANANFPQTLGNEFAGTVTALGSGVAGFAIGDAVLGWSMGDAYADAVVVPSTQCAKKPRKMPWDEAGALSASGQTASTALDALDLRAGETVIVHAAAGGVGSMAVQIAVAGGAVVIGTASPGNHAYLHELGAKPVDYHGDLAAALRKVAPNGADAALIAVGGEAPVTASLALVGNKQRIVTTVFDPAAERQGIRRIGTQRSVERLASLLTLYENGQLAVYVAEAIPFSRAAEAHRLVETGHVRGKIVLTRD